MSTLCRDGRRDGATQESRPRPVTVWLDRLREALPPARADEVTAEVEALVDERLAQEGGAAPDPAAVERALSSLGSPEALAQAIADDAVSVPGATRRAFFRALPVLFGGHLLLSAVLTAVSTSATLLPGLVSSLPMSSVIATALGVVGIFLFDVGLLVVAFAVLGRERSHWLLLKLRAPVAGSKRDGVLALVLLSLVAAIANVPYLRDGVFSLHSPAGRLGILAPEAVALIPVVDAVLGLFALRALLRLAQGDERVSGLVVDGLAALSGSILSVLVLTRDELVLIPTSASLSAAQATLFADVIYRIVLVIAFVSAVLLLARFVRRALRIRELLA